MRRVTLAARRAQRYFRRPPRPRWLEPALYAGGAAVVAALLAGAAWWVVRTDLVERTRTALVSQVLAWTADAGLVLEEVYVDGRMRTDLAALRGALGVDTGRPILGVDLATTKAEVERLPWVDQAIVSRLLPDVVHIQLLEREPLALWQRGDRFSLVDRAGRPIQGALANRAAVEGYRHLRVLVGEDAPRHAAHLFAVLSTEPDLWRRVVAATRIGDRRWTVRLDNEVDVLLPEDGVLDAWRFLAAQAHEEQLLERALTVVDLRFLPGRMRLRLDPAILEERRA